MRVQAELEYPVSWTWVGRSWSEFLRAQAHSLGRGGLRSALADGLDGLAAEPSRLSEYAAAPLVEADGEGSRAAAAEPRLPFSAAGQCRAASRGCQSMRASRS